MLVASEVGIRAVLWEDDPQKRVRLGQTLEQRTHPMLIHAMRELDEYFARTRTVFTVPLDPIGTDFQKRAWDALTMIPYGETRSYAQQAQMMGHPKAVRAVGAANGKNPISIIVPCHRVIGANGTLTGFAGGLAVKSTLLQHEAMR
ncbi:MAG: methylated-DNA--[protein]-cysteine S-methyltransferase [Alphaproteobacteria bacterium]|nr:MAG: methylated-DNA--[protein]-cysteine S-methyltransferase [Alphaproteobacteria bacterium]